MLSLVRAANTVRPVCARALATAPDFPPVHSSVSPPPAPLIPPHLADAEAGGRPRASRRRAGAGAGASSALAGAPKLLGPTVFVRPWNSMQTMVDGLAILQALERKYGRVIDVFYPRDADLRNNYLFYFKVTFHASVDPHIVPADGETLKIRVPDTPRGTPIAFEDLQRFLSERTAESDASTDLDAEAENWRVEDVRIERSTDFPLPVVDHQLSAHDPTLPRTAVPRLRPSVRDEFAHAWTGWAGFSTPIDTPADAAPTIVHAVPDTDPALQHLHATNARWQRVAAQAKSRSADAEKVEKEVQEQIHEMMQELREDLSDELEELAREKLVAAQWEPFKRREEKADALTDVEAHADARAEVLEADVEAEAAAPKMSRRERILQQARESARAARDEGADANAKTAVDEKEQEAGTEKAADAKLKSIQERLWKLVATKW
ncbi:hypothetical protein DENSPDRAFT_871007 [Dentipellis sp. KUC8613]|nr:hypothetical protein DENSPDRAFT_871007 [Dentipellis sp. KUC8613]